MKNIPEKIYLIIGDECPSDANFKDLREVTWSSNSNFKNDIEYVLATEDKKAPEPITISKSDGTGEIEILPEVKKLAIAWIENYVPHGSIVPEIGQKWKLAEDIQRIVNLERNKVIQECIDKVIEMTGAGNLTTQILVKQLEKLKK